MDERERRLAGKEAIFREVNERIQGAARGHGEDGHLYEYVCECSRTGCTELVSLTIDEYEGLRALPDRFALVAGHELPDIERIVAEVRPGTLAVEKLGAAAEEALRHDPRAA
jgi:hypothetical protein